MKPIGIVGVAPWATLDFINLFYQKVSAKKDWEYPHLIVDLNTQIPSRGRFFDLNEKNPSEAIRQSIQSLLDQGAYKCAVICNTAHILFDEWGDDFGGNLINLLSEVGEEINKHECSKFSVIGSSYLNDFKTYEKYTKATLVPLSEKEQAVSSKIINLIKTGNQISQDVVSSFYNICDRLENDGTEILVLGCTELSFLMKYSHKSSLKFLDSNDILAETLFKYSQER